MLLCGWPKRKKKQSTSQDRCATSVPIEEEKQIVETSIAENITAKPEDCTNAQNFNQSMLSHFTNIYFVKMMLHFEN